MIAILLTLALVSVQPWGPSPPTVDGIALQETIARVAYLMRSAPRSWHDVGGLRHQRWTQGATSTEVIYVNGKVIEVRGTRLTLGKNSWTIGAPLASLQKVLATPIHVSKNGREAVHVYRLGDPQRLFLYLKSNSVTEFSLTE